MARFSRDCVISEKIDGTNASIIISNERDVIDATGSEGFILAEKDGNYMFAGSRTRLITPEKDNFGFAGWVKNNAGELFGLGLGRHFGEWWGSGIQRNYGLKEKRFSLFNVGRWSKNPTEKQEAPPEICSIVPIVAQGMFGTELVEEAMNTLREKGSLAQPGFMNPEGIVIFHIAGNLGFKKTLKDDETPKSLVK